MFSKSKITEIYCIAEDFCKEFALQQGKYMVEDKEHKHRNKPNRMNDTEINDASSGCLYQESQVGNLYERQLCRLPPLRVCRN